VLLADHADPDDPDIQRHDVLLDSLSRRRVPAASGSRLWPSPQRRQRQRSLKIPSTVQGADRTSPGML
jgi:hypothetical protein